MFHLKPFKLFYDPMKVFNNFSMLIREEDCSGVGILNCLLISE